MSQPCGKRQEATPLEVPKVASLLKSCAYAVFRTVRLIGVNGAGVSVTTKAATQVPVLPHASTAFKVTLVVPGPTMVPAGGLWVIISALVAVQLSENVVVAVKSGTVAWQLESTALVWDEQLTIGALVSTVQV